MTYERGTEQEFLAGVTPPEFELYGRTAVLRIDGDRRVTAALAYTRHDVPRMGDYTGLKMTVTSKTGGVLHTEALDWQDVTGKNVLVKSHCCGWKWYAVHADHARPDDPVKPDDDDVEKIVDAVRQFVEVWR